MDVKKTSLIIAGLIWLSVGAGLSIAGINWLLMLSFSTKMLIFSTIAVIIGLLKGKFVLRKVALKYARRADSIEFGKNDMFTGWARIFGIRGFILIGIMMMAGSMLRHSNIDRPILGLVYLAVGIALVYASKIFFSSKTN